MKKTNFSFAFISFNYATKWRFLKWRLWLDYSPRLGSKSILEAVAERLCRLGAIVFPLLLFS